MKRKSTIDKDVAEGIVKLCFSINALGKVSMDVPSPQTLLITCVHKTIKEGLDAALGAPGTKTMLREMVRTKGFVKDILALYQSVPNGYGNNPGIMSLLDEILANVTELENLFSNVPNRNP